MNQLISRVGERPDRVINEITAARGLIKHYIISPHNQTRYLSESGKRYSVTPNS